MKNTRAYVYGIVSKMVRIPVENLRTYTAGENIRWGLSADNARLAKAKIRILVDKQNKRNEDLLRQQISPAG